MTTLLKRPKNNSAIGRNCNTERSALNFLDEDNWRYMVRSNKSYINLQRFLIFFFIFLVFAFLLLFIGFIALGRYRQNTEISIRVTNKYLSEVMIIDWVIDYFRNFIIFIELERSRVRFLFFHEIRVILDEPFNSAIWVKYDNMLQS